MGNVVPFQSQAGRQSREISRVTGRAGINHSAGKERAELIPDTLEEPAEVKTTKNPTWKQNSSMGRIARCVPAGSQDTQQEVSVRAVRRQRAGCFCTAFVPVLSSVQWHYPEGERSSHTLGSAPWKRGRDISLLSSSLQGVQ